MFLEWTSLEEGMSLFCKGRKFNQMCPAIMWKAGPVSDELKIYSQENFQAKVLRKCHWVSS